MPFIYSVDFQPPVLDPLPPPTVLERTSKFRLRRIKTKPYAIENSSAPKIDELASSLTPAWHLRPRWEPALCQSPSEQQHSSLEPVGLAPPLSIAPVVPTTADGGAGASPRSDGGASTCVSRTSSRSRPADEAAGSFCFGCDLVLAPPPPPMPPAPALLLDGWDAANQTADGGHGGGGGGGDDDENRSNTSLET